MRENQSIAWASVLAEICRENSRALRWEFPEPWIQTELFAALDESTESNGWEPFPMELPYVTFGPVTLPRPGRRDWRTEGSVKWVDLCLRSKAADDRGRAGRRSMVRRRDGEHNPCKVGDASRFGKSAP